MKHQFNPAVVTSVGVLLCFFAVAFAAKLGVFYWLGAVLVALPLFFRILWLRCATECGPAKKDGIDVPQPKPEDVRKERDHMETVLNNRVNFLVAASAIIGAVATQPKGPKDQATVFVLGACIAALSLVGIDRSCTKLNYYLSWLNRQKDEVIRIFDDDGDLAKGLPGSVYACTYGVAYFILVIFVALAITVSLGANPS
ncbi:MAG: hypothetical protein Q8S00_25545 [Deltaproteobacteria bacterium]|nr:hypothetical protein [Deltaproteobacteria bacterium]